MRPRTLFGPSALAARAALTAESRPPERPRMPLRKPALPSSSRRNAHSTRSTKAQSIFMTIEEGPLKRLEHDLRLVVPRPGPRPPGPEDFPPVGLHQDEVTLGIGGLGQEAAGGRVNERASGEGHPVLEAGPVAVNDEGWG